MVRTSKADPVPFPTRGTPGGWRDGRDDPDDAPLLRPRALAAEELLEWKARLLRDEEPSSISGVP